MNKIERVIVPVAEAAVVLFFFCLFAAAIVFLLFYIRFMKRRMKQLAYYDPLTRMPNRYALKECLAKASSMSGSPRFTLYFIDVDNFKQVNDSVGHEAGDALLCEVGRIFNRLAEEENAASPKSEQFSIASRYGGDEFVLVIPSVKDFDAAVNYANNLLSNFANHMSQSRLENRGIHLSVGAAVFGLHTRDTGELLQQADFAMYEAKKAGRNRFSVYENGK
ncbi:MAG: GGDEF domain-containing protein [Oscillospiraceae bacterium]|nr:GGDEF domain-containing protein [Oscillospiraceae bacterium]